MKTKKNNVISIIVPIYNSEKHLYRCLESLINQNYKNIEILMIDDGSTDTSKEICYFFLKKDKRFKYFSKNNGGVSSSRNYGLKKSSGEYIMFIDSDDWVDKNYCLIMIEEIKKKKYDLLISKFDYNSVESCKTNRDFEYLFFSRETFVPNKLYFYGAVWGIIFNREVIKSLLFDENIFFGEDMIYLAQIVSNSDCIGYTNKCTYHYWKDMNEDTLSKGNFNEKKCQT